MVLLSSTQQGSDPMFTFITLLGTKPLTYGKFTKDLNWLLKQLDLGTGYSSHSFRRGGATFCSKVLDHFGSSILVTPHVSVNVVKMVNNLWI